MPKTSAFDHPKFEHHLDVHSWMFKACGKNLYAALLLAYLEDKFNELLVKENKNKGWMKLNKFQLQNGIFAESWHYVEEGLGILSTLKFIQYNPNSPEFPREETEMWIKVNALEVNRWLSVHKKSDEDKMKVLDWNPFLAMMLMHEQRVVIKEEVVQVVKEVKTRTYNLEKFGQSAIATAKEIFQFWRWIVNKPRAQESNKFLKMICDRLSEKYTIGDCAQACFGMVKRKANPDMSKYDDLQYIFGDSARMNRMISDAESIGWDNNKAFEKFEEIISKIEMSESLPAPPKLDTSVKINVSTGAELL